MKRNEVLPKFTITTKQIADVLEMEQSLVISAVRKTLYILAGNEGYTQATESIIPVNDNTDYELTHNGFVTLRGTFPPEMSVWQETRDDKQLEKDIMTMESLFVQDEMLHILILLKSFLDVGTILKENYSEFDSVNIFGNFEPRIVKYQGVYFFIGDTCNIKLNPQIIEELYNTFKENICEVDDLTDEEKEQLELYSYLFETFSACQKPKNTLFLYGSYHMLEAAREHFGSQAYWNFGEGKPKISVNLLATLYQNVPTLQLFYNPNPTLSFSLGSNQGKQLILKANEDFAYGFDFYGNQYLLACPRTKDAKFVKSVAGGFDLYKMQVKKFQEYHGYLEHCNGKGVIFSYLDFCNMTKESLNQVLGLWAGENFDFSTFVEVHPLVYFRTIQKACVEKKDIIVGISDSEHDGHPCFNFYYRNPKTNEAEPFAIAENGHIVLIDEEEDDD